jgi:SHS2 domain-containing protein
MKTSDLPYQIIDHTADVGIIIKGTDLNDRFIRAAYTVTDPMMEGNIGENGALREITVKGEGLPELLVRWLGEVLYLFAGEKWITDTVEISALSPTKL